MQSIRMRGLTLTAPVILNNYLLCPSLGGLNLQGLISSLNPYFPLLALRLLAHTLQFLAFSVDIVIDEQNFDRS